MKGEKVDAKMKGLGGRGGHFQSPEIPKSTTLWPGHLSLKAWSPGSR